VDHAKTKNNKRLIGEKDWLEKTHLMIDEMKAANHLAELTSLKKRRRKAEFDRRVAEGPKDPWRPTRHGPMREVILTASHKYFDEDLGAFFGEDTNQREEDFERIAVKWLKDNFGDDVVHAHADKDELAYHIHAVIVPRVRVDVGVGKNTALRERLQPSKHELIRYYEKAQDSVGEAFAGIGLVRGERRRAAYREAMRAGKAPEPYRANVKTWKWRMAQDLALKEREAKVSAREAEAEAILAVAEAVAAGDVDPEGTAEALAAGGVERAEEVAEVRRATLEDDDEHVPETPSIGDKVVATPTARPDALTVVRGAVNRAPKAAARVFAAFGAAWTLLRRNAEAEAQEAVREEFSEIKAADKQITRIAVTLGSKDRARIAFARGGLAKRVEAIARRIARARVAGRRDRQRGHDGDRAREQDQP